ncbi:MAG: DinB family protein [Armatimonadetes bacterium]|nr:DinB family protein [Armatimonadota bacterium]NOG91687.1 DinB family protein [Armatimonadota bacterium]
MESKVEFLRRLQDRAFRKSPWHSLLGSLDGVEEDVFTWTPDKSEGFPWMNGSIQDILYHATGDKLVQCSHAFGDSSLTWDNLKICKASLPEMITDLMRAQSGLEEITNRLSDSDLERKVAGWGGKRQTVEQFLLMLIEHDYYHAGQIIYVRNIAKRTG